MIIGPKWKALCFLGLSPTGDLGPLTGYTSKRGKAVWFLKAPPTTPGTRWQVHQRNVFRLTAQLWRSLTADQRADWEKAAKGAHLNITGHNLFVWFQHSKDRRTLYTIERQSGVTLLP